MTFKLYMGLILLQQTLNKYRKIIPMFYYLCPSSRPNFQRTVKESQQVTVGSLPTWLNYQQLPYQHEGSSSLLPHWKFTPKRSFLQYLARENNILHEISSTSLVTANEIYWKAVVAAVMNTSTRQTIFSRVLINIQQQMMLRRFHITNTWLFLYNMLQAISWNM